MKKHSLYLIISLFSLSAFCFPKELMAAPYFEGKKITIIVGFAPGGGYDRMARLLASHLPKYIPGKPKFIIKNIPGGSSMIAANRIYNVSNPDGTKIATIDRGLPLAQLLKVEGVEFDLRKYSWIGSTAIENDAFFIRYDLPYKTFEDVINTKKTIYIATGGPMTTSGQYGMLIKKSLNLDLKIVTYTNLANARLAIENGEADGITANYSSLRPLVERKLIRPLLRPRKSQPGIEHLPVDEDLAKTETGKTLLAMLGVTSNFGRPYVAPPGVPASVIKILREGFFKVSQDQKLLKDAKRALMQITYIDAEECLKHINFLLNQPEDIVKKFSENIKF